ncbi:hypothetical protein ACFWZU_00710 [Frateuria sp. GZRR33]|uniref:hypothetical protein n=1 Tax=Frateuria sp. GZRR33 TaxID=3351535 RepID=UPI003EDC433B
MNIDRKRLHASFGWLAFLLFLVLGGVISLLRGQDNWWDITNYHIYNPWSLLHDRWGKDLYVAGSQGYFHPWLDIPYYLAAMEWFPSRPRLVSFLAGLPYGFLIFVVFHITRKLFSTALAVGPWERRCLTVATTVLAVTGVSAWTQAGTTTNEVTVAALVLSAVYLLLTTPAAPQGGRVPMGRFVAMGALVGAAAGLKLTAAVYVPALGLAIIFQQWSLRPVVRALVAYGVGFLVLFLITYGPWAWHLYQTTGNPLFPMLANVFVSPFSAPASGQLVKYLPSNIGEWLFYPFYWLNDKPTVYNKLPFRDGRIAAFYVACIVYFCAGRWLRKKEGTRTSTRSLSVMVFFCAASYIVWLVLFSMLRYAIVIEAMASLCTVAIMVALLTRAGVERLAAPRSWAVAAFTFLLLGFTHYPEVPRIGYSQKTFSSNAPQLPKNSLVIMANQPMGLLAPLIQAKNPGASFVGIPECFKTGLWCNQQFFHYGLGDQIRNKLAHHRGPIFVAFYTSRNPPLPQLPLFGIQFSRQDCLQMRTNTTGPVSLCGARYKDSGGVTEPVAAAVPPKFDLVYPSDDVEKSLRLNYKTYQRLTDGSIEVVPLPPGTAIGTLVSLTAPHKGSLHVELSRRECAPGVDIAAYRADQREPFYQGQMSYASHRQTVDIKIDADRYPAEFILDLAMPRTAQHNWFCNVSVTWQSHASRYGNR